MLMPSFSSNTICQNIQILLGGFETKTGEQWLAFRNDGKYSAADYPFQDAVRFCLLNGSTMFEKEADYLIPGIHDLAFSVDIRYSSLEETSGPLSEGLWRRATAAGAFSAMEKRAFGIADDIYEAGLLLGYLVFIRFSEAGIFDSLSLQRLLESTFKLDMEAKREYSLADDRLSEGVKFLDLGDGAGWELLQAMLNPNFRKRSVAEAVVKHWFLTGAVL